MTDPDELATYWGILNRNRMDAEHEYARVEPTLSKPALFGGVALLMLVIGVILCAGSTATILEDWRDPQAYLFPVIIELVGGLFVFAGVRMMRMLRARSLGVQAYGVRRTREHRRVLKALAARWGGTAHLAGTGPARRFLSEHWPDSAPQMLLRRYGSTAEAEERQTLLAAIDGRPLLVQILDFAVSPLGSGRPLRPPAIAVLAASPLDVTPAIALPAGPPFRTSASRLRPEEHEAWAGLIARGFVVRRTRAGVYAVHEGPADALLETSTLEGIANQVVDLCRIGPEAEKAARARLPPDDPDASSPETALQTFLRALRDGDTLRVLGCAHPRLLASWLAEPGSAELDEVIDGAGARPLSWGNPFTSWSDPIEEARVVDRVGRYHCSVVGEFAGKGRATARVCITRVRGRRWCISGYGVAGKQILGVEEIDGAD